MSPAEMNEAFAASVVEGALAKIGGKVEASRNANEMSTETWYNIKIPYDKGTDEYAYFDKMLGHGSLKDANYLDLFERILKGVKAGLAALGVRAFTTLNCRFDAVAEDNFILYVFTS